MLLGFYSHGRRAGKDTAAGFVQEWCHGENLSFERRAFADVPKLLVAETLGIGRGLRDETRISMVDQFKLTGRVGWSLDGRVPVGNYIIGRDYIINLAGPLGEERPGGARRLFGESFWTDIVLPPDWEPTANVTAITDVRSDEEALRVNELGGYVLEIVSPRAESPDGRSERGIDARRVRAQIHNAGSLNEFRVAVQAYVDILWASRSR